VRTGIVLAGGRSSRFGSDKLAAPIDGDPLLDRAIAAVAAVTDEVIVAGRAVVAPLPSTRGVPDAEPFAGPLVALRGALEASLGTIAIVVGGDMPELVPEVLRAMLDRLEADATIDALILARPNATSGDPPQVLPMAIRVAPAGTASRAAIGDGRRSLRALLDHLAWTDLSATEWLQLDPGAHTLLDVDTRADLERIRAGKGR